MTADIDTTHIRAGRRRLARSRGAMSGLALMILGAWAAVVPFIGPYIDLAYTPAPNSAWHWTAARGWLEVLPGAAVFLGGLMLLLSASRAVTVFGGWLAALAGAWLVVGPSLAGPLGLNLGQPDPTRGATARAVTELLFFYAVGALILFFASLALGRVSVVALRDIRAAERRGAAEEAQRQAALEAAAAEEQRRAEQERAAGAEGFGPGRPAEPVPAGRMAGGPRRRRFHLPHRHRGTVAGDQSAGQGNEQYAGNQQYPGNQPYSANQPYPGGPQQGGAPGQPGQYPSAPPPRENG